MQLDSTLEMSLEESTDTLPHVGLDQTADQSDLPDRNGFIWYVRYCWYEITLGPRLCWYGIPWPLSSPNSESTEDKSNTEGLTEETKSQDDMSIDSTEDDEV